MRGKDRDAEFAEFYTARFEATRRIAHAMCGNWSEAEEIAQTAFVKVYAHWPRVRTDTADAYLRTVLTRVFLDGRRRGRAREHPVAEPPDTREHRDPVVTERMALHAALLAVPPGQRAVLVLRYVADLPVEEVAAAMRCSVGNVKSQAARGLATLRAAYQGGPDPVRSTL